MTEYNDYLKYLKHVEDTTAQDFKARENVLIKDISDLKAQFKDEKSKIENVHKDEKAKIENQYNNNISDLKSQFKAKEDAHKKEISDLQAKHKDEKTKIENLFNNNISDLKAQFKTKEDTLKKEISNLQAKNNEEISKLKEAQQSEISKYKKDLEKKSKEISDKNNTIKDLQSKLDSANYEIECWRNSNVQIQEQRNQLMYIRSGLLCVGLIFSIFPCFGIPILVYFGYAVYKVANKEKYISVLRWARCDKNTSVYANKIGELFTP